MRLSRRALIAGGIGGALVPPFAAYSALQHGPGWLDGPTAVEVSAAPIALFDAGAPDRTRFGDLIFRGGLNLRSSHGAFGGYSALWRSGDGCRLVAVSDTGTWLTAEVETVAGRLSGLRDAVLAPILGRGGTPLSQTRSYDTEGLAMAGGEAFISIERTHEVMRFPFTRDGVMARGQTIPVPAAVKKLPANKSLEAIAIAPASSPVAGAVVVIAERANGHDAPTNGFILTGSRQGTFEVLRPYDYDITDMAFLPDGDLALLERRANLAAGLSMRIRRIAGADVRPGARLDGPVMIEAGWNRQIDNMEGLAVHREADGTIVLTLISDDNFAFYQRTLLLEFALAGTATA